MILRERIESQTGFECTIRKDLIELLVATNRHALVSEESRTWMLEVSDVHRAYFNYEQRGNESLSDHTRSFKETREILHSHLGGSIWVSKALEEIHPAGVQVEENDEGGLDMLFGVDQETEVD